MFLAAKALSLWVFCGILLSMTNKIKLIVLIVIGVALIGVGSYFYLKSSTPDQPLPNDGRIILFYRDDCPQCQKVEEYLATSKVEEKVINIEKKEVSTNQDNINLLLEKAALCKISEKSIGVPFLWAESKCIVGDADIIKYFGERIANQ